jgi:muramoyltetrapeptide carboxypeptidase
LCTRGGFGVIRILKDIDYNLIKNNPKIIAGYSDITALLAIIHKKTGLLTFHSPMANGDFGEEDVDEFTAVSFFSILQKENKTQIYKADENFKTYYQGTSRGILWGGNLSTIASLSGTDFIPDKRFNLFLEDLNEPVYKLDKMLTQLLNIDKFKKNLSGIIIGKFTGIDKENYLEELFKETAENLSIPTCNGFKISHDKQKYTLAIGIESEFNASKGTVTVDSYCVT